MNLLGQSAFLKALGWALLHSLWQMGVLWLLYVLLTADGKRFQSRQRYHIALIFVSLGTIAFLVTLAQEFYTLSQPQIIFYSYGDSPSIGQTNLLSRLAVMLEPALPFLSAAYLTIIGLLFVRFFRQYYFSRKLISSSLQKIHPEYRIFLDQMAQRFAIKKNIRIGLSDIINTPLTVGFWKPVILLPIAASCHLSVQQTEAIILHELNHIKQNDYLVNLLIAALDILLFFNPFSRLLTGILVKERENCCDDMVLQFRYPAVEYAHALLLLEQQRATAAPVLALHATGTRKKILLHRVERILSGKNNTGTANVRMLGMLMAALLIAFTGFYNPARVIHEQLPDRFAAARSARDANTEISPIIRTAGFPAENTIRTASANSNTRSDAKASPQLDVPAQSDADMTAGLLPIAEEENGADDENPISFTTSYSSNEPAVKSISYNIITTGRTAAPVREFSIQQNAIVATAPLPEVYYEVQPFVPSNSLTYQIVEDTAFPKKYIPTPSDLKAQEDLEKALKAIETIDWEKLGKEVGGKAKVDIDKLQSEIKKALAEVDWKKIEEEIKSGLKQAGQDLKLRQVYLDRMAKFQKDKAAQQLQMQNQQKAIIRDRLLQNEELKKCEEQKKVKKIVVI